MPNTIAPPYGLVIVAESLPCTVSYNFQGNGSGLTPAGVTAITSAVSSYLSQAKITAIGAEQARVGGALTLVGLAALGSLLWTQRAD